MRKFYTQFIFLLLLAAGIVQAQSIQKGPYLTRTTSNSIYVNWQTDQNSNSRVAYGLWDTNEMEVVDGSAKSLHFIRLTGLQPDTEYLYRIYSGSDSSDVYVFRTLPDHNQPFTFTVFGDNRTSSTSPDAEDEANALAVINQMMAQEPAFAFHTGDIVKYGDDEYLWQWYWDVAKHFFAENAVFFTPGNHEDLNDSGSLYYHYMNLPKNNPDSTEGYYSFDLGNSHFIGLNCTDDDMDYNVGSAQYQWLEADLAANESKDFIFVFFHFPLYSTGSHGSTDWLAEAWEPLFQQYGVDIVFSGHDHSYERTIPIGCVTYVVTGGAGAPLYSQSDNASWSVLYEKTRHFVRVDVDGQTATVRMIRPDGSVGDQFSVSSGTQTAITDNGTPVPQDFSLSQNYPNPFNGMTRIEFDLPEASKVSLLLYNSAGEFIGRIIDGYKPAGSHHITFHNNDFPSGVYFYTLRAGNFNQTRKMIFLK